MRSCQPALKLLLPHLAALTLLVLVVAEAMCFVHCNFGGGHGDADTKAEHASCHGTAATQSNHSEDGPSPKPTPKGSCATLQNLLTSNGALTVFAPEFPALYLLSPLVVAFDATASEPTASIFRDAGPREWALTPEVYLGPAIHSLAPPLLR
jgi:hypothetical protein